MPENSKRFAGKVTPGDPETLEILRVFERLLATRSDQIVAADARQLARIGKLVKGVKID